MLEGTLQDETGDFPTSTYVRNPPGSGHAPGSETGCTIFVKLWQFRPDHRVRIVRLPGEGTAADACLWVTSSRVLFEGQDEFVTLEEWQAGAKVDFANRDGFELLVLAGGFSDGVDNLSRWSWFRVPAGLPLRATVDPEGARVWTKAAPLLHNNICPLQDGKSAERQSRTLSQGRH